MGIIFLFFSAVLKNSIFSIIRSLWTSSGRRSAHNLLITVWFTLYFKWKRMREKVGIFQDKVANCKLAFKHISNDGKTSKYQRTQYNIYYWKFLLPNPKFSKKTLNSERKMYGTRWLFYSALKILYFDIDNN